MSEASLSIPVVVCLGSSCFARGNADNLAVLKQYEASERHPVLELTGSLCQSHCRQSPTVRIGEAYHHNLTAERLRALLAELAGTGVAHGAA